jgi:hypothetical protein
MTSNRFDEIVEETITEIRDTLVIKGKEYRRNNNPFHNFDEGSRIKNISRERVLDGMLLKHEISINDITNDIDNDILPKMSTVREKFGDNLIYLILKKASIIDKIEKKDGEKNGVDRISITKQRIFKKRS